MEKVFLIHICEQIGGFPLTYDQQNVGATFEHNTGQNMEKGGHWNIETLSPLETKIPLPIRESNLGLIQ